MVPRSLRGQIMRPLSKCIWSRLPLAWLVSSTLTIWSAVAWAQPAPSSPPPNPSSPVAAPPVVAPVRRSEAEIQALIEQLGDSDYFVREGAQTELARLGFEAFDALTAAEHHADFEIATRARHLLKLNLVAWTDSSDTARVNAMLVGYENLTFTARVAKLNDLAQIEDDEGLPALCRLVRFERSALLSKLAASAVLGNEPRSEAGKARRRQVVDAQLTGSKRPGAQWLLTAVQADEQPEQSAARWTELVDQEIAALDRFPGDSQAELVVRLLRWQVQLWQRLNRRDEALAVMRKIVQLEDGRGNSLTQLLGMLTEAQAWEVIDEVAERFEARLNREPMLLYALARARRAQGDEAATAEAVGRARQVFVGDDDGRIRLELARTLQGQGLVEWANDEYRLAMKLTETGSLIHLASRRMFAEYLHDQDADLEAAETLDGAAAQMDQNVQRGNESNNGGLAIESVRSRAKYLRAVHAAAAGDRVEERRLLHEAIGHDSKDAEVIIAMFRLPDQTPAEREATAALLKIAADEYRRLIQREPDNETMYNQLAWLISNTEGDFDEALRCSQKSLELRPGEAGYLDTLARCYYAKGDLANAVKYQTQAAQLEPHTRQINKQLELFRTALEAQKK